MEARDTSWFHLRGHFCPGLLGRAQVRKRCREGKPAGNGRTRNTDEHKYLNIQHITQHTTNKSSSTTRRTKSTSPTFPSLPKLGSFFKTRPVPPSGPKPTGSSSFSFWKASPGWVGGWVRGGLASLARGLHKTGFGFQLQRVSKLMKGHPLFRDSPSELPFHGLWLRNPNLWHLVHFYMIGLVTSGTLPSLPTSPPRVSAGVAWGRLLRGL